MTTTILITGASRGIGLILTQRAIPREDTVFPVVHKEEDKSKFGNHPHVYPILLDVSDAKSVERGFVEIDRLLAGRQAT